MSESDLITATILVPRHVVSRLPHFDSTQGHYIVAVHRPGVLWRGLIPVLLDSPELTSKHFLECMLQESMPSISSEINANRFESYSSNACNATGKTQNDDMEDLANNDCQFWRRSIQMENTSSRIPHRSIIIQLRPPWAVPPDRTFTSMLVRLENALSKLSALTAWWATLGGGYFFCRRISHSLQLARQQKALALMLGNVSMARYVLILELCLSWLCSIVCVNDSATAN